MLKFRIIGFTLLMGLLGGIFFWRPWGEYIYLTVAPLMTALAVYECARMLNDAGKKCFPALTALFFYVFVLAMLILKCGQLWLAAAGAAGVSGGIIMLFKSEKITEKYFNSCGVLLFLAPALAGFLASFYNETGRAPAGAWLLFLCLATKATDTGGYIVGTLTSKLPGGNHKIAPALSPKKSWEGLLGGIALSLTVGYFCCRSFGYAPMWWYLTTAGILGLGSFFGDLAESAVKRMCNVKDSGHWVPGMGGAFDVFDSFIFNGIIFYLPLKLLELI